MVQVISGKKRFLVRFQYGCEKYIESNQLATMKVEKSLVEEEPEVPRIYEKPVGKVPS